MNINYCTKCEESLKQDAKFCTNCGQPVHKIEQNNNVFEKDKTINQSSSTKKGVKKSFPFKKVLLAVAILVFLIFMGKSFFSNTDQLSELVGEWHEPTGKLLGDKEAIIKFRKKGDIVVGEDLDKTLYIQLLPTRTNNYSGLVVLNGNDSDFLVDYYKEENKLVFFSTLTKTSWYLKRIKY